MLFGEGKGGRDGEREGEREREGGREREKNVMRESVCVFATLSFNDRLTLYFLIFTKYQLPDKYKQINKVSK